MRIVTLNQFANIHHIRRGLNGLPREYNLYRRIRSLQQKKLLEPLTGDGGAKLGFRLTKRGISYARANHFVSDDSPLSRPAFKTQYDHDQVVTEVKQILDSSTLVSKFIHENELRSRLGKRLVGAGSLPEFDWKVPDAMFSLTAKGSASRAALEVELTQKAKGRYTKIIPKLITSRDFEFVFFVCKDEKLVGLIESHIVSSRERNSFVKASNRSNGIYFCTLEALRTHGLNAVWTGEENRFSLNDLAVETSPSSIAASDLTASKV